jgi:hypothetical protein
MGLFCIKRFEVLSAASLKDCCTLGCDIIYPGRSVLSFHKIQLPPSSEYLISVNLPIITHAQKKFLTAHIHHLILGKGQREKKLDLF